MDLKSLKYILIVIAGVCIINSSSATSTAPDNSTKTGNVDSNVNNIEGQDAIKSLEDSSGGVINGLTGFLKGLTRNKRGTSPSDADASQSTSTVKRMLDRLTGSFKLRSKQQDEDSSNSEPGTASQNKSNDSGVSDVDSKKNIASVGHEKSRHSTGVEESHRSKSSRVDEDEQDPDSVRDYFEEPIHDDYDWDSYEVDEDKKHRTPHESSYGKSSIASGHVDTNPSIQHEEPSRSIHDDAHHPKNPVAATDSHEGKKVDPHSATLD